MVIADATRRLLGARLRARATWAQHELKGIGRAGPGVRGHRRAAGREPVRGDAAARRCCRWSGATRSWRCCWSAGRRPRPARARACCWSARPGSASRGISRALLDALADEPHIRIRYQCSPYHTDSALWPVIQQLSHAAGLARGRPARGQARQAGGAARPGGRHAMPRRLIAELLGLDGSGTLRPLDLTPQAQRARTLQALARAAARAGRPGSRSWWFWRTPTGSTRPRWS